MYYSDYARRKKSQKLSLMNFLLENLSAGKLDRVQGVAARHLDDVRQHFLVQVDPDFRSSRVPLDADETRLVLDGGQPLTIVVEELEQGGVREQGPGLQVLAGLSEDVNLDYVVQTVRTTKA